MGFWPFGRKNRRSSRIEEKGGGATDENMPLRKAADPRQPQSAGQTVSTSGRAPSSYDSKRQKREPGRDVTNSSQSQSRATVPSRAQTAPNPSSNENNPIQHESLPPYPGSRQLASRATQDDRGDIPSYYFQNPTSQSSLGPENFSTIPRPPTLRAKRSSNDQNFSRRKSSKRKAEDQAREKEIRAMSSPVPASRPSTRTSDPLRRDTKKIPGGLNRHFERPSSNISLPLAESLHDSISEASEQHTFTVNAFSALTPRPTLRYSADKSQKGPLRSINQSRASAQKEKRPMIPEEDTQSAKRIEGLADELNASGLRELMERDQRRRERKRQQDQEKLQQKLERRAARQREENESKRKAEQGEEFREQEQIAMENMEREAPGSEAAGLGIENVEPAPENPFADHRAKSPGSWLEDPSREHLPQELPEDPFRDDTSETLALQGTKPDVTEQRTVEAQDIVQQELALPVPPFVDRQPRASQGSVISQSSPLSSPVRTGHGLSSTSQLSGLGREVTPDIPENQESERRDSDTSGRHLSNWTSFFKRGGTRQKRSSADRGVASTPSEFSNTSRESFARQAPPPPIPPRSFRRSGSTPVRTMSKFREDLPELPKSPPETKILSPEASAAVESLSPHPDRSSYGPGEKSTEDGSTAPISASTRESAHRSLETNPSEVEPRSAVVSQSLASVDSEASWLSGKPVQRNSVQSGKPLRESGGSLLPQKITELTDPREDADVTEDEYFARLTPGLVDRRESGSAVQRKPSSSAIGIESDVEDEGEEAFPRSHEELEDDPVRQSVEHFPTLVHAKPSKKSREGLLQEFQSSGSEATSPDIGATPEDETPGSGTGPSEGHWIHRATSVDYGKTGKHARHISAGSAKLLDVPRRTSIDSRSLSNTSVAKTATSQGEGEVQEEKA